MDKAELYNLLIRMFAASIFVHDALYVCRDGREHVTNCFLPVFGLRLSPAWKISLHVALVACCFALVLAPVWTWLYPVCLGLLTLKISSYSLRLSNHMIFAWFIAAILTWVWVESKTSTQGAVSAESMDFVFTGIAGLVLMLYGFAFFHKLNSEYLCLETSCATAFVDFFCWDRNVHSAGLVRFYRYFGVYGTLALEVAIPVLLFVDTTRPIGLFVAIIFHYILGLMGIINFSMFMYTGLIAFLHPSILSAGIAFMTSDANGQLIVSAFSAVMVLISWKWTPRRAARHCPYRHRVPAWVIQTAFAVLTAVLMLLCVSWMVAGTKGSIAWSTLSSTDRGILAAAFIMFFLNGITPYLGIKTEFSFAMFSNLRIEPWTHLLVPEKWRLFRSSQYVDVQAIQGLPNPEQVVGNRHAELGLYLLSRHHEYRFSRYFFREGLLLLRSAICPKPTIRVHYIELGIPHELEVSDAQRLGPCLRMNRFPFAMPKDIQARHSEQGFVLGESTDRQLF